MTRPDCSCYWVENPWTYYGAVEPGGAVEPNHDCPAHFPERREIRELGLQGGAA